MATNGFDQFIGTDKYIVSPDLRDVVNVAIALQRPLVVKGEPGTGKTLLAHNIARALNKSLLIWNVKSTTKARDGLYIYDTVQRLNDARFGDGDVSDVGRYIRLGTLGQSFAADEQVVLLIDEVDKADIEFPNDLLNELDEMNFHVLETDERVTAKHRPIVIITSNSEKELPDAFLRRCVFHYITFPDQGLMAQIVGVHHPHLAEDLLSQALERFYELRQIDTFRKKPSTSELIDWLQALVVAGVTPEQLEDKIPFLGVLLKKETDFDVYMKRAAAGAGAIRSRY